MFFTPEQLEEELRRAAEPDFRVFTLKLQPGITHCHGVRIPKVRALAKTVLLSGEAEAFLQAALAASQTLSLEARLVAGLVIAGRTDVPFAAQLALLEAFLPLLNGWVTTDVIGSSCKSFVRHPDEGFDFVLRCLSDSRPWIVRFGMVLAFSHYKSATQLPVILEAFAAPGIFRLTAEDYYVSMALAWALSVLYLTDAQAVLDWTVRYAEQGGLTPATVRRTAQKIRDSRRVSASDKAAATARLSPYASARFVKA